MTDLTAEQRADLKAKAEAQLAKHHWAARRVKCCQKCRDAKEVLGLLAENARLQRELTVYERGEDEGYQQTLIDLTRAEGRAEAVSAQLASAVARIAELGAENGRLFRELAEAQQKVAAERRLVVIAHEDYRIAEAQLAEMRAALEFYKGFDDPLGTPARAALASTPDREWYCDRCDWTGTGTEGFGTHKCK